MVIAMIFLTIMCGFPAQNFYKSEVTKEDMYIRYIHKLYELHLQAENYTGQMKA